MQDRTALGEKLISEISKIWHLRNRHTSACCRVLIIKVIHGLKLQIFLIWMSQDPQISGTGSRNVGVEESGIG